MFHYFYRNKTACMKRWNILPVLLFLIGCRGELRDTYFTPEKALRYFKKIENICNKDDGKLWGKNLYGPIMFVDRSTRKIVANQPDNDGILKEKDGIYTGIYPKELIINNIAIIKLFAENIISPILDSGLSCSHAPFQWRLLILVLQDFVRLIYPLTD